MPWLVSFSNLGPFGPFPVNTTLWRRVDGVKTLRRTLVGLVPEVLVEVRVRDLLEGLHFIHRYEMRVEVHELDADLLERSLG